MSEPGPTPVLETVTGPATLDAIQQILDQAWSEYEVPDMARMYMDLAAGEIGANIIQHSGGGAPVRLRMEVKLLPDTIEIRFTDDGHPVRVNLSEVALPGEFAERGRGLAIAHRVLDELPYRRDAHGNHWTLIKRRAE